MLVHVYTSLLDKLTIRIEKSLAIDYRVQIEWSQILKSLVCDRQSL